MQRSATDWGRVIRRIRAGDRVALIELSRLITTILRGLRAYDFRDDWDDVAQDVIVVVVSAYEAGRIRTAAAIPGFVRTVTRRQFMQLINAPRSVTSEHVLENAPWSPEGEVASIEMRELVERLPQKQREVIETVYYRGETRERAAQLTGVPLSSLKRYQSMALSRLKAGLSTGEAARKEKRAESDGTNN